jgi:predicted RNA-binding Zn ribbon-like protein
MSSTRPHRPSPAAIIIVPLAVALVLTLFAWPNARLEPRDLPIGVAGAPAAAEAVEQRLAAREGAFDIHRYSDEAAARRAIEDREVYGAFVVTRAGAEVLVATAASPAVAQMLTHAASGGGATGAGAVPVRDVVAASPAGGALASSVLPLVIAGLLTGAAAATLASGALACAGLVVAGSILAGVVATAIVHSWLDVVQGSWAANAAVLSLTVLAIASVVAGLEALLGKAGLAVAALTMILIGNPFSGVGTAPEMLPEPAGAIGQLLPPGAGGNLLRSTGFFDGAAAGEHVTVLVVWVLVGLAALLVAGVRDRPPATARAPVPA